MKKKMPDVYDSDKDTARVRKHAERFSFSLSVAYLIFMFFLGNYLGFPIYGTMAYPIVFVIGSVLYLHKKIPRKIYEYWFAFSATALCIVYAYFSGSVTVALVIYLASFIMTAMFRDERLIFFDMIMGIVLSAMCFFVQSRKTGFNLNSAESIEFILIPIGIMSIAFALNSLVKRDKKLFLFSQQKNRNNLTLLQIVETKREEAEDAVKVKTEFLANTSHEIRTPMNSIMGMTELAMREDISPQVRNYLANIRDAGTNLLNIINDILDFSKIESGKTELSVSDYSIVSVMNDICNITSIRMNNESVQLITCIDPEIPALLSGDERRIKQIILNLASNAIKYTRHGSITINVFAKPAENDNIILHCEVKDTGIGIKEADIKRLFNAFERADTKRNRNIEGTGLGLAICKSLAEMMGGTIKVRSIYGAGSVFGFEIPQKVKDNSPCIKIKNGENKNILLCMKNREQLNAVSSELTSLKLHFTAVQDISTLSVFEIDEYSDILIDMEEYNENRLALSRTKAPVSVFCEPGEKPELENSDIRRVYRPVTIISLLTLFSAATSLTDNKKNPLNKHFSAPDAEILVVDDNSTNLLVAKRLISLYKANIDTADSGIQALKMVQKKDYDLVFMDHMMPELDGIETAQAIRSLGGKYSKLPIIALTANVISGAAELFRESGMDDFLGKPIEMTELHRVLSRYIPSEKQIEKDAEAENFDEKSDTEFRKKLMTIKGLDIDTALKQCNNDINLLSDILRSAATTPTVKNLCEAYEKQDLHSYTIYVHGIKGALRNVGMADLGNSAYDLELAGKREDAEYIRVHHDSFMEEFNEFSASVLKVAEKKVVVPAESGNNDELRDNLCELISAAKDMDYTESKKYADIICSKTYGEKIDEKIRTLCEQLEEFEFEQVIEIAVNIEEEIK